LSKEIEDLQNRYQDIWASFKTDCARADSNQSEKLRRTLLERHYANGESLLGRKDFDSALGEFSLVKSLDPGYKDVDKKLDAANNKNSVVAQSDVYRIVSPKRADFLIGTSQGVFESSDRGRTWKPKALAGKRVYYMDALGEAIVVYDEKEDVVLFSATGGRTWRKSNVQYNAATARGTRASFFQPNFPVKVVRLIPFEGANTRLILLRYTGTEGVYGHDNQVLRVEHLSLGGFGVYEANRINFMRIPDRSLSPNGGANWVGFFKVLWSYSFYGDFAPRDTINAWIDFSMDYSEEPDNAVSGVVNWIAEKRNVSRGDVKVTAYSTVPKAKKDGNEQVVVATNFGVYRTCWECDRVEEIIHSGGNNRTLSVYLDQDDPNLIMLGLANNGLLVSEDGGLTWKGL
jgi:hypothetical protein